MPSVTRAKLLVMSPAEQRDRFGLSQDEEIHKLRRALLGLEGPAPDPKMRWIPRSQRPTQQIVPDVVGLTLDDADKVLSETHLTIGNISYQDSDRLSETVLSQNPKIGATIWSDSAVELTVAAGLACKCLMLLA